MVNEQKFCRHKILVNYYNKEILRWDWNKLLKGWPNSIWLGTITGISPSGKFYMPWTTNQTKIDVLKDECFFDALENIANQNGYTIDHEAESVFLIKIDD